MRLVSYGSTDPGMISKKHTGTLRKRAGVVHLFCGFLLLVQGGKDCGAFRDKFKLEGQVDLQCPWEGLVTKGFRRETKRTE
jgi:hypothetical protein